jgi:hypothetical protein
MSTKSRRTISKKVSTATKAGKRDSKTSKSYFALPTKELIKKPQTIIGLCMMLFGGWLLIVLGVRTVMALPAITVNQPVTTPLNMSNQIILEPKMSPLATSSALSTFGVSPLATEATQLATPSAATVPTATATPSAVVSTTATESAIISIKGRIKKVKVAKDQTFGELASRYCGTPKMANQIARANGYRKVTDLKENDVITINCK